MGEASSAGTPSSSVIGMFLLVSIIGGMNSVAVKFGFAELAPFWGAAIRSVLAAVVLLIAVIYLKLPLPKGREYFGVAVYGTLNVALAYAFGYYALTQVSAGTVQVSLSLVPLMVVFLAAYEGVETLKRKTMLGASVAAIGTAIVFYDGIQTASWLAIVALLGGSFCIAQAAVTVKRFPKQNPIVENAFAFAVGGPLLLGLSFISGENWSVPTQGGTILSLGFLVLMGTVVLFTLYVHLINIWSASAAAYSIILMPIVTVILGAYLLGEAISTRFIIGGVIMVGGVYYGAMFHPHEHRRPACC